MTGESSKVSETMPKLKSCRPPVAKLLIVFSFSISPRRGGNTACLSPPKGTPGSLPYAPAHKAVRPSLRAVRLIGYPWELIVQGLMRTPIVAVHEPLRKDLAKIDGLLSDLGVKLVLLGLKVDEVCRKNSISTGTYYNWKSKYGGMGASELKRVKELEAENSKLKRMYADLAIENDAIKDLLEKKPWSRRN